MITKKMADIQVNAEHGAQINITNKNAYKSKNKVSIELHKRLLQDIILKVCLNCSFELNVWAYTYEQQ
jgi:hypothetical protein